jgi:hypothetical protein
VLGAHRRSIEREQPAALEDAIEDGLRQVLIVQHASSVAASTYGDEALRIALTRGLAEQAIGAEYIAHYLAEGVTTPAPIGGDPAPLPFDPPAATATSAPRGGRVQAAAGARRAGAERRAWTRLRTVLPFDADGGRS